MELRYSLLTLLCPFVADRTVERCWSSSFVPEMPRIPPTVNALVLGETTSSRDATAVISCTVVQRWGTKDRAIIIIVIVVGVVDASLLVDLDWHCNMRLQLRHILQ